jgi:uncharacterized phage-associated protein
MRRFNFDKEKAISSVLYITEKLPKADLHKISKILYFADQKHLVKYGRPICGDFYVAMESGPVPSQIYDMLKTVRGDSLYKTTEYNKFFKVERSYIVLPLQAPDLDEFSESDLECLNESIDENRNLSFKDLKTKSHGEAYHCAGLNSTISFENIAKEGGAEKEMINFLKDEMEFINLYCV